MLLDTYEYCREPDLKREYKPVYRWNKVYEENNLKCLNCPHKLWLYKDTVVCACFNKDKHRMEIDRFDLNSLGSCFLEKAKNINKESARDYKNNTQLAFFMEM